MYVATRVKTFFNFCLDSTMDSYKKFAYSLCCYVIKSAKKKKTSDAAADITVQFLGK